VGTTPAAGAEPASDGAGSWRAVDGEVEILVEGDEPRAVRRGAGHLGRKAVLQRGDAFQCVGRQLLRRLLRGQAFEVDADARDLAERAFRHQRHAQRAVGREFQRLLGHEPVHGLAHGHDADTQRTGRGAQRDLLARNHLAGDQQFPELGIDIAAQCLAFEWGD
jgi:hypothetical protein